MKSIVEQVDEFMNSVSQNLWLDDGILAVYVRKGRHLISREVYNTFDVANIRSLEPEHLGKGYFRTFMEKVESLGLPVYVENIHNPALAEMLEKNGYTIILGHGDVCALKVPV